MNRIFKVIVSFILLSSVHAYAEDVELLLENGSVWNGVIGQTVTIEYENKGQVIKVEGELVRATKMYIMVANKVEDKFVYIDKILSISSKDSSTPQASDKTTPAENLDDYDSKPIDSSPSTVKRSKEGELPKGFFILPMEGMVGHLMRPTELRELVEHIDENYGPGQIIVLKVNSGGGIGHVWSDIRDFVFEARERHRIVAWVESAISAAAMTVYCCDEIYYTSLGEVGSCSGYRGSPNNPLSPEEQQVMITEMEKVISSSSRSLLIAGCMFMSDRVLSYSKDPQSGEITYYDTLEGDTILSNYGENMTLYAEQAVEAGLADGIANSVEELAEQLNLPKLDNPEEYELSPLGRELFAKWEKTFKEWEEEGPKLFDQFVNGNVSGNTEKKQLDQRIRAGKEILKWAESVGETGIYLTPPLNQENVNRMNRLILELEHQKTLADD